MDFETAPNGKAENEVITFYRQNTAVKHNWRQSF
jgi:hypothetical protein